MKLDILLSIINIRYVVFEKRVLIQLPQLLCSRLSRERSRVPQGQANRDTL